MKLRALTAHIPAFDQDAVADVVWKLQKVEDEVVWTKRVALPPLPRSEPMDKVVELADLNKEVLFGLVHLDSKDPRVTEVPKALEPENAYASILVRRLDDVDKLSKLLAEIEPEKASRLSLTFSDYFVVTPYFPSGTGDVALPSLSASVLYVSEFDRNQEVQALAKADELAKTYARNLGLKYLGLDVSLSPWKEESLGRVIEQLSGRRLFEPSHLSTVFEINQRVFKAAVLAQVNALGFSEVMLPVAEDDVLTQRVSEGSLRLRDLISLSFVCVAGLDMIAVRADRDLLASLIKAMYAVYYVKRRPVGMRVIPTPGGDVVLKKFGRVVETQM
ncbi:MAG: DUF711 family protein [Sulfolobales archaeon]|nr:DUF711 family protein [Sulfolobales archaeon]